MICRDPCVGAAGQTAPTKSYQPSLEMLLVVVVCGSIDADPLRHRFRGGDVSSKVHLRATLEADNPVGIPVIFRGEKPAGQSVLG